MSRVQVPPNPNYCAEVLVILTSLGAKRSELNAGRRVCDFFETKRVHHKVIDLNVDARAGVHNGEDKAIQRLEARNEAVRNEAGDLPLPQIFVDGCYLGDSTELQSLEDDGVLGRILRRQVCLRCHKVKPCNAMTCPHCYSEFEEILPNNWTILEELKKHYQTYGKEEQEEEDSDSGSEVDERWDAYNKELEAWAAWYATPADLETFIAEEKPTTGEAPVEEEESAQPAPPAKTPDSTPVARPPTPSSVPTAQETKNFLEQHIPTNASNPTARSRRWLYGRKPNDKKPKERATKATPLTELRGHLWKKSPNLMRLRPYEKRFFVLRDMQLLWWKNQHDAEEDGLQSTGPLVKGFINMMAGPVQAQALLGNDTTFHLKPRQGNWVPGSIAKGDAAREFTLDATDSEHSRETWVECIREHISRTSSFVADLSWYADLGLPAPTGSIFVAAPPPKKR